ncbi:MAG: hypothetical protein AAF495_21435 [Pseudomonadota bacterium]
MNQLFDRKFMFFAVYLVGAVIAGTAYMVHELETNATIMNAIPGSLERAFLWPIFIFTGFFG